MNLDWDADRHASGRRSRPTRPTRPTTGRRYDRVVLERAKNKIQVLFTIIGTPRWANGKLKGTNRAPKRMADLRNFALAAAKRYSGKYKRDDGDGAAGRAQVAGLERAEQPGLPAAPVGEGRPALRASRSTAACATCPLCAGRGQGVRAASARRSGRASTRRTSPRRSSAAAPPTRAATTPRGAAARRSRRLRSCRTCSSYGLKRSHFDVYAHHPYYSRPNESADDDAEGQADGHAREHLAADQAARGSCTATRSSGSPSTATRRARPTRTFGVTWAKQAKYLTQAYAIARKNPRITMMLWFLLRDERPRSAAGSPASSPSAGRRSPPTTRSAACHTRRRGDTDIAARGGARIPAPVAERRRAGPDRQRHPGRRAVPAHASAAARRRAPAGEHHRARLPRPRRARARALRGARRAGALLRARAGALGRALADRDRLAAVPDARDGARLLAGAPLRGA